MVLLIVKREHQVPVAPGVLSRREYLPELVALIDIGISTNYWRASSKMKLVNNDSSCASITLQYFPSYQGRNTADHTAKIARNARIKCRTPDQANDETGNYHCQKSNQSSFPKYHHHQPLYPETFDLPRLTSTSAIVWMFCASILPYLRSVTSIKKFLVLNMLVIQPCNVDRGSW